jgi:hypothetical protein
MRCAICRVEIRVSELSIPGRYLRARQDHSARAFYPVGSVSWCPNHGLGWVPADITNHIRAG